MNYKHSYSINSKTKREKIKIQTLNLKKCTEITERTLDLKTNICKLNEVERRGCERTWPPRCGQTYLKWHGYVQEQKLHCRMESPFRANTQTVNTMDARGSPGPGSRNSALHRWCWKNRMRTKAEYVLLVKAFLFSLPTYKASWLKFLFL